MGNTKVLVLSDKNKARLMEMGYPRIDIWQIEKGLNEVELSITDNDIVIGCKTRKCGVKRAIEVLGEDDFLSGLGRASFHATATRYGANGRFEIHFDLCKWWK